MKKGIRKTGWYIPIFLLNVFLLIDLIGISQAQETQAITLGKAIQIALENNIELKRFSNQVVASELSVRQAKADFYPNLNASASASVRLSSRRSLREVQRTKSKQKE